MQSIIMYYNAIHPPLTLGFIIIKVLIISAVQGYRTTYTD